MTSEMGRIVVRTEFVAGVSAPAGRPVSLARPTPHSRHSPSNHRTLIKTIDALDTQLRLGVVDAHSARNAHGITLAARSERRRTVDAVTEQRRDERVSGVCGARGGGGGQVLSAQRRTSSTAHGSRLLARGTMYLLFGKEYKEEGPASDNYEGITLNDKPVHYILERGNDNVVLRNTHYPSYKLLPGSCYLFSCGPPEDFRCKFTAHGNFSSGVLALSRRLAELQDSERLATHERELANLRNPTSTTATTTLAVHSTEPPPAPSQPTARRCSRYQFECRRGGECIAVYNACDGVPQCADGSDEAPELDCPSSPGPPAAVPPARLPQLPAPHPRPTVAPTTRALPLSPLPQVLAESGFAAVADSEAPDGADPWPRRLSQAQPRRYTGGVNGMGGSHIFSHKGGLLQPSERESAFEAVPPAGWPRRAWQPLPGPAVDPESERGWGGYGHEWPDVEPRRAWPVPRPETDVQMYLSSKTMPEMPMIYSSQQQTLRDGPKKGFEILSKNIMEFQTESPPRRLPPPAPGDHFVDMREENKLVVIENTTKKKALKTIKTDSNEEVGHVGVGGHAPAPHSSAAVSASGTGAVAALEARARWPNDDHDGLSEHPPAAVLLLILGSLMTVSLAALAGCRARAARRRRRAHPRLALDADYLVNGMYL